MKRLIIIGGPTASGKTSLSIALAQTLHCDIINADSRQVFKEMNIGTAKPSTDELEAARHHLIGHRSIHEAYSVGTYEEEALAVIHQRHLGDDHVVAVGGTGLYLKALQRGIDIFPNIPKDVKDRYNHLFETSGLLPLQEKLKALDPEYYASVDTMNPHRLIRALSVIEVSGKPFSSFLLGAAVKRPFEILSFAIQMDRQLLYNRINTRVDLMMESGLLEEASSLHEYRYLSSLNTVGYKELFDHFEGNSTLEYAVDKIKQHTRNYAKRQVTWFKNQGDYRPISSIGEILSILQHE